MFSDKSQQSQAFPDIASLEQQVSEVDAISFDFFDTLFVRTVLDPEDVFDIVGLHFDIPDFRNLRRAAQSEAFRRMHQAGKNEITLAGIYDCFTELPVSPTTVMNFEYQTELEVGHPNLEMLDIFFTCLKSGKPVVLTSDMYLPEKFFIEAFERHGIPVVPMFISADCDATKRDRGELFDIVVARLKLKHGSVLHIGDNAHSDIKQGMLKGLQTYHYTEHRRPLTFKTAISVETSLARGLLRKHTNKVALSSFKELGFLYGGPAAVGFLEWISRQAREDKIDVILFLSRDGYILDQIARIKHAPELPRYEYFLGSRVAYTLAAITDANFANFLPFFLSGAEGLSLYEILERIAVPAPANNVITDLGLDGPYTPTRYEDFEKFIYAYRWKILQVCQTNRYALSAYLNSLGIRTAHRVAIVDVGWSGTTQDAFETAIESILDINVFGYYFCLADTPECAKRRQTRQMSAMFSSQSISADIVDCIYKNRAAAELFFSAPHQSVIGLKSAPDGSINAIEDSRCAETKYKSEIQTEIIGGMKTFSSAYFNFHHTTKIPTSPLKLAMALVEYITEDGWRDNHLFHLVKNFDAWAFTRNRKRSIVDEGR